MKLERLLALIVLLLNNEKTTAKELAEHFEVTERTIYRDIEAINIAGIPVVSYAGRNGGFGILDSYKIDKNILTANDLSFIITALTGIKNTIDDKRLNYLLEKIKNLLPGEEFKAIQKEQESIIIDFSPWDNSRAGKENVEILKKSLKESKIISFSYTDVKGEGSVRKVEPIALIAKSFIWYLYGYCLKRGDFRVFRLSRIKKLTLTDETFVRRKNPDEFSWDEVWFSKIKRINLVLKFSRKWKAKAEDYFGYDNIEEKDDFIIVKTNYPDEEWLKGMILGFGNDVEVLEPEYLRKEIKEMAEKIFNLYNK